MPSFSAAIRTTRVADEDSAAIYVGSIDQEWSVLGKPHGGYLLACIVGAANAFQATPPPPPAPGRVPIQHLDPAHMMSQFLRAGLPGPYTLHVRLVKAGLNWTNLDVKMYQSDSLLVTCQALYTTFPALPLGPHAPFSTTNQNLLPATPSSYASPSPFVTHPSKCSATPQSDEEGRRWSSNSAFWFTPASMKWSEDPGIKARREGSGGEEEQLELEWGAWCAFKRPEDTITTESLAFFSDLFSSLPELLPPSQRVTPHYYPTLALSLHFHARLPLSLPYLSSPKTVGCYSTGKFVLEGRHEQCSQVWSAPGEIGEGEEEEEGGKGWRRRGMLLVSATQLALTAKMLEGKMEEGGKVDFAKL